jgi:hypothetical protein
VAVWGRGFVRGEGTWGWLARWAEGNTGNEEGGLGERMERRVVVKYMYVALLEVGVKSRACSRS